MMTYTPELIEKAVEYYGDRLADPEVFPATFHYQMKILEYGLRISDKPETTPEA